MTDRPTVRVTVTGKLVGPLRRSTFERGEVDREWSAVSDVVYWASSCRLQAHRLVSSYVSEFTAFGKRLVVAQRMFSTTSYDQHCMAVAAANLDRALERAEPFIDISRVAGSYRRSLRLLRNIYEHWDELRDAWRTGEVRKGDSAFRLRQEFPEAKPWTLRLEEDGDVVMAEVLSLKELVSQLRSLEASARWRQRQLRREGRHRAKAPSNQAAPAGIHSPVPGS